MPIRKFKNPIYVTRPILPDIDRVLLELKKIWQSKELTNLGKQHKLLTQKISKILGSDNVLLFNNGTTGLLAALKSFDLSGEVITTPFTFPATPHALTWNNLQPVFCDIDKKTLNIDADKIEELITPKTTAILGVHIFGTPCDVLKIESIAKKYNLKIIYDAAHAFMVEFNGQPISQFGDAVIFSFHATKLFHTVEGGAVVVSNNKLKEKIELYRNFGIKKAEHIELPGINGKMNEIQAAIGLLVYKEVKEEIRKRKALVAVYRECLENIKGVILQKQERSVRENYQYFVIRIKAKQFGRTRDDVFKLLKRHNIYPSKYFYPLCSEFPYYRNLVSANRRQLPIAFGAAREIMAMPLYGKLSPSEVRKICEILLSYKKI